MSLQLISLDTWHSSLLRIENLWPSPYWTTWSFLKVSSQMEEEEAKKDFRFHLPQPQLCVHSVFEQFVANEYYEKKSCGFQIFQMPFSIPSSMTFWSILTYLVYPIGKRIFVLNLSWASFSFIPVYSFVQSSLPGQLWNKYYLPLGKRRLICFS